MQAIILSIGDELVSGLTTNTNSAWLAEQLTALGIRTLSHMTVGDDLQAIVAAIRDACERLDLESGHAGGDAPTGALLITGGLGPTADDVTRQALGDALHQTLVEDPDAMLQIENWFQQRGRVMSYSNRLQAMRPQSAGILENMAGTAPGLRIQNNHTEIMVMPGVPREMREMFTRSILPVLKESLAGHGEPIVTQVTKLNTFGMGESVLGEKIKDLMVRGGMLEADGSHVAVGTTVHDGIVSVRIYATGTKPQADLLTARVRALVIERFGTLVFSENEVAIETVVAKLLQEREVQIATAESCTGGLLATLLTNTAGSSAYFTRGWITYANAAKENELNVPAELIARHGAVSESVARAMAEGALKNADADYALATTGIAGPDGGSPEKPVGTVWIALSSPDGTEARRFIFPGDRTAIRMRACQMALSLLRWKLLGVPAPL